MNALLQSLIGTAPAVILCILGIIFAVVQREKAPKAATCVILSLVVLLALTIVRPLGARMLIEMKLMNGLGAYYFVCNLVDLATTAGLLFAAFCDREAPSLMGNPYAKDFASFPPQAPPSFPGTAPLPPLGGSLRPPQ
jgi:hypothetical protein